MAWMYAHRACHVALNMPTLTGSPALASVQHPQTHALENWLRFTPEMNPAHEIMNPAPRAPISVHRLLLTDRKLLVLREAALVECALGPQ